ncbi:hypothetical protein niasHT_019410 [Heterodera trifolii]|uniref:Uncharacterized protein n=1 Tax=Heterodera trifolii TaxID=157864 RepID=A0ABD2KW16_9BILA
MEKPPLYNQQKRPNPLKKSQLYNQQKRPNPLKKPQLYNLQKRRKLMEKTQLSAENLWRRHNCTISGSAETR